MSEPAPADELALAQRAAAGEGDAFAVLYQRYERRTYNLCLRIVASEDDAADATQEAFLSVLRRLPSLADRDLSFGSYVFTSARNACYDLLSRRKRTEPSDEIAEGATPVGSATGGGGIGFDPGDPEDDPERNVLLKARSEEIQVANAALPERQREVLALKELEGLSYDEIAEIMGMNRNSVAQLISRARINLRDALRGTALASIASATPECERALPLMAARADGQLDDDDDAWLTAHLRGCETCGLAVEAMAEAGVSYRAWVPVAAAPFLLRETIARAAELTGSDWSEAIERAERRRARGGRGGRLAGLVSHPRVDIALATAAVLVLLLVVLVGRAGDAGPSPALAPVLDETATTVPATTVDEPATKAKPNKKAADKPGEPAAPDAPAVEQAADAPVPAGGAADPVADAPAQATPRARKRTQTVGGGDAPESGSGLDQPAETTPVPPVATTPEPEPPVVTTPEVPPEQPPTTPCGTTRSNPCPPQPPQTCIDPATGRPIPCGRVP